MEVNDPPNAARYMSWSALRLPDRLGRHNGSLWEVLFSVERALMVLALLRFH
jgi:hypothetical protein